VIPHKVQSLAGCKIKKQLLLVVCRLKIKILSLFWHLQLTQPYGTLLLMSRKSRGFRLSAESAAESIKSKTIVGIGYQYLLKVY
jgi:hypothetical protein